MNPEKRSGLVIAVVLAFAVVTGISGQTGANADSVLIVQLEKRAQDYLRMRRDVESHMPALKPTAAVDKIDDHERQLGKAIRVARRDAGQGNIFTPEIAGEIRRLVGIAMKEGGAKVRTSLRHDEPNHLHLKVNDRYPHGLPLQSMPVTLLENLPRLPPEIEYRLAGSDLVLLDAKANVILDVLPAVIPPV